MRENSTGSELMGSKKIMVVYFSHSGNTRALANHIHKSVGGDIFEIQSVEPYPRDYDACVQQAKQELNSGYKPPLKTRIENITSYDVVFVGYPIWWGTIPAPVRTFLSEYDFSAKTLAPFCTHEGTGLGRSVTDVTRLCPTATLVDAIAIRGSDVKNAQKKVAEWLAKIKMAKLTTHGSSSPVAP